MRLFITVLGCALGTWMAYGTVLFGLGSQLNLWYTPIALVYIIAVLLLQRTLARGSRARRRAGRATWVCFALACVSALAFGFTVPCMQSEQLESITSVWFGEVWREMSIALCNPFGVLALVFVWIAFGIAAVRCRENTPGADDETAADTTHTPRE